jgi:peptide/nickel transport system ATP-binding protein
VTPLAEPQFAVPAASAPAVRVSGLTVSYATAERGFRPAVRDVSLTFAPGAITGVTGESGSGKTSLALAMLNGVSPPGRIEAGRVEIDGVGDLLALRGEALRRVRGRQVGLVFQAAQNSLNPLKTVGGQILDLGRSHRVARPSDLLAEARRMLARMGLDAERVLVSYQHELSGGMRQRVNIVFALLLGPKVVILDEPTTALDLLSQWQVVAIVREFLAERHVTGIVVTHDLGVVAELADRVVVLYGGAVMEEGPVREVLRRPAHPYTRGLIDAMPRLTGDIRSARPLAGNPPTLLSVPDVGCVFRNRCPIRMPVCAAKRPPLADRGPDRRVACWAVTADA